MHPVCLGRIQQKTQRYYDGKGNSPLESFPMRVRRSREPDTDRQPAWLPAAASIAPILLPVVRRGLAAEG